MISRMTKVLACGNGILIFFLLCFNIVSGTTNEPKANCNHAHLKCGLIAGAIGCISTFIPFLISHFLTYVRQHIEDIWTAPRTNISSGYEEIGSFHSTDSKSYFFADAAVYSRYLSIIFCVLLPVLCAIGFGTGSYFFCEYLEAK